MEQKKALFHKNPKEKYKPQNQTMTDDSDDTHPNLFLWKEKAHAEALSYYYLFSIIF